MAGNSAFILSVLALGPLLALAQDLNTDCQALGDTFKTACNTTAETTAGATCPTGCMDAYTALNTACAPTNAPGGWNETAGGPWSQLMWEVAPTWGDLSDPREDVTVEGYVTWLTLSNHLVDRCPWAGKAGTCDYQYLMALEASMDVGEDMGYDCLHHNTDGSDVCSDECQSLLDNAKSACGPTDTYTNMQGITADNAAMMMVLDVHYTCGTFACTPPSMGASFCDTLHTLYVSGEASASMVPIGCNLALSGVSAILATMPGLDMPLKLTECLAELAAGDHSDVIVKDICYCTDQRCPLDNRADLECAADIGYVVPPPPPPPPVEEQAAVTPPPVTSSGRCDQVLAALLLALVAITCSAL